MKIHKLKSIRKIKSKRVGRGPGSGKGKTSGRGHKGQKSRSGFNIPKRFEGGQTSLIQKLPKKGGFKSFKIKKIPINFSQIENKFDNGEKVNPETLYKAKLISNKKQSFKILASGNLTKKLIFEKCLLSEKAKKTIENMGK